MSGGCQKCLLIDELLMTDNETLERQRCSDIELVLDESFVTMPCVAIPITTMIMITIMIMIIIRMIMIIMMIMIIILFYRDSS